jgi:hypothetical protein
MRDPNLDALRATLTGGWDPGRVEMQGPFADPEIIAAVS